MKVSLIEVDKVLDTKQPLEAQKKELDDAIQDTRWDMKMAIKRRTDIDKLIKSIHKLVQEQESLLAQTYTDVINKTILKISALNDDIRGTQDTLDAVSVEYDHYNFWANAYGNQGIKSVLLDSVTPFLNKRANGYLSKLADSSITVTFNTQTETAKGEKRDKFSVEVTNNNGDDEYKGNSNGEKRRIDIAVNMSLQDLVSSRTNKSIDLIVYDECFEGLDSVGCESVVELLKEKARVFGSVFVITHNDNLKQLFSNSVTVTKDGSRTEVEYG
jgi:DNA repair exonuclease SbcCD ATPase subunit